MTEFAEIFLSERPLLDVRAPIEFNKGAFPTATNLPILDDEQRHLVGICYQEQGPEAAEQLGHQLVDRDATIALWQEYFAANPDALLYCFRGGKRSQLATEWLKAAGINVERITGGYKALRTFLLQQIDQAPPVILLSGKTGVGKTELLPHVKNTVDLEGLANHRGSAFGGQSSPQPSQTSFENSLAIDFLRHKEYVVLEDESRLIGRIHIPPAIQESMKAAPICLLEDSLENRVARIHAEYVMEPLKDMNLEQLEASLLDSLNAIQRRLGGARHKELVGILNSAIESQKHGDAEQHKAWIEALLVDYYDPMYDYQLSKKSERIQHRVNWRDVGDQQLDFRSYCS